MADSLEEKYVWTEEQVELVGVEQDIRDLEAEIATKERQIEVWEETLKEESDVNLRIALRRDIELETDAIYWLNRQIEVWKEAGK